MFTVLLSVIAGSVSTGGLLWVALSAESGLSRLPMY